MRVGLVGAGPWAMNTHAPALAVHPGVDFAGVWARNPDAAQAIGARVFGSYAELVDSVDAVAFAVPPSVQAELALFAAMRGKHLIMEKPVAATLKDAARLATVVRDRGVRSVVFFTRRFAPETRQFLDEVADGEWSSGDAVWLSGALLGGAYSGSQWRQVGGALDDVGPHLLDLLDVALGPVTDVVCARCDVASDTWKVLLEHSSKRFSSVTMSLRTPVTPSLLRVSVQGRAGFIELATRDTPAVDCYQVMLDEFFDCGFRGVEHPCSVERGLAIQRVMSLVAVRASSDVGSEF
ncbi:Gfo/Idh/MocA family oxidoreductase [Hoyosella rhizosphaerae]|uniref:Dehydrogenase n=1 Tax=Hoyosella rhizosphaerae TaxID=1755582 RepID=A0A916XJV6_9ACTN|nr:Gfo/Idh/MocA family oxidoreductase [Hoyosella rhizosphaerae]MBN4925368.1 Gfo/Idh/MocA family oxidoreductase [Hoyosella rhizosphaerae]GGC75775.1 dehydrogenase [Hoyosella rhizosphaerae]